MTREQSLWWLICGTSGVEIWSRSLTDTRRGPGLSQPRLQQPGEDLNQLRRSYELIVDVFLLLLEFLSNCTLDLELIAQPGNHTGADDAPVRRWLVQAQPSLKRWPSFDGAASIQTWKMEMLLIHIRRSRQPKDGPVRCGRPGCESRVETRASGLLLETRLRNPRTAADPTYPPCPAGGGTEDTGRLWRS